MQTANCIRSILRSRYRLVHYCYAKAAAVASKSEEENVDANKLVNIFPAQAEPAGLKAGCQVADEGSRKSG